MFKQFFSRIRSFFERLDHSRDEVLFLFIKPYWPKKITPNQLTGLRIIIGIFLFILLFYFRNDSSALILTLFSIGALTDMLDGSVARALGQESKTGAMLDSIADRLLLAPIAIYSLLGHPKLFLSLVLLEIANFLASLYAESKKIFMKSNIFGKVKMVMQSFVFIAFLVFWNNSPSTFLIGVLWLSALSLALSVLIKFIDLRHAITHKTL